MANLGRLLTQKQIVAASQPLADKCGIYFLIKQGEIVYIGQSVRIDVRLLDHRRHGFDSWHWIPCPADQLDKLERAYLDRFAPPLNADHKTKARQKQKKEHEAFKSEVQRIRIVQRWSQRV